MLKRVFILCPFLVTGIKLSFSEEPDVVVLEEKKVEYPSELNESSSKIVETVEKKENSLFITPFKIVTSDRMALTPNMDTPIDEEYWDIFSIGDNMKTYLQWEPGTLYGAAKVPVGKDLVVSLSTNSIDWLTNQSIEVRFKQTENGLKHDIQKISSDKGIEVKWIKDKILSNIITSKGSKETDGYHVRFRIEDCVYKFNQNSELGIRFDLVDSNESNTPPYLPRLLQKIKLVTERDKGLPYGFSWHPFYQNGNKYRYVVPGENLNVKFETKRPKDDLLSRIQLIPRGVDADKLTFVTQPYPEFNRQDKASFSYNTLAPKKTVLGYKILTLTPNYVDKNMGYMESSFKVSDPILFELELNKDLKYSEKAQIIKGTLKMISATNYKIVGGRATLNVPMHWKILEGEITNFSLHTRDFVRHIKIEIVIPGDTEGVYPLKFKVVAEGYEPIYHDSYIILRR